MRAIKRVETDWGTAGFVVGIMQRGVIVELKLTGNEVVAQDPKHFIDQGEI